MEPDNLFHPITGAAKFDFGRMSVLGGERREFYG